jgi:putative iron-dependent peroxidase
LRTARAASSGSVRSCSSRCKKESRGCAHFRITRAKASTCLRPPPRSGAGCAREAEKNLAPAFETSSVIDAFKHGRGLDLTGYEDGTENPKGKKAVKAAIAQDRRAGFGGASFVAVQQWVHDLDKFAAMPRKQQDHAIGRRKSDNREIGNAPASSHVKRTTQESFSPQAFVLRRSMPWADATRAGLVFVAFGKSLAAFEAQLKRMVGAEDGMADALFAFTRPVTGAYFWCPPIRNGRLDLRAIGL